MNDGTSTRRDAHEALREIMVRTVAAERDAAKRAQLMDHLVAVETECLWDALPVAGALLYRVMQ